MKNKLTDQNIAKSKVAERKVRVRKKDFQNKLKMLKEENND